MKPILVTRYGSPSEKHVNLEFDLNQEMHDNPRVVQPILKYLRSANDRTWKRLQTDLASAGYEIKEGVSK